MLKSLREGADMFALQL